MPPDPSHNPPFDTALESDAFRRRAASRLHATPQDPAHAADRVPPPSDFDLNPSHSPIGPATRRPARPLFSCPSWHAINSPYSSPNARRISQPMPARSHFPAASPIPPTPDPSKPRCAKRKKKSALHAPSSNPWLPRRLPHRHRLRRHPRRGARPSRLFSRSQRERGCRRVRSAACLPDGPGQSSHRCPHARRPGPAVFTRCHSVSAISGRDCGYSQKYARQTLCRALTRGCTRSHARVVIENILLFLLPTLAYIGWVLIARPETLDRTESGRIKASGLLNDAPLVWLTPPARCCSSWRSSSSAARQAASQGSTTPRPSSRTGRSNPATSNERRSPTRARSTPQPARPGCAPPKPSASCPPSRRAAAKPASLAARSATPCSGAPSPTST